MLLIEHGVMDRAALVAASLGDLPYTVKTWREKVDSLYGKRAGSAWHELALSRIHGHSMDCLRECHCSPKKKFPTATWRAAPRTPVSSTGW